VSFDVLVVLGCRVVDGRLSHASLRRVERAVRAYREHGAAQVIACGGKSWQGHRECEVFARGLIDGGVPAELVVEERASLTTRGNARGAARLLAGRGALRVGLVTCDWHMPRALRAFRREGLEPAALPAPAPRRPLRTTLARSLRERLSSVLDWLLPSFWLVCLLCACSKPHADGAATASATPVASSAPKALPSATALLAELRRDASLLPAQDLTAESAAVRAEAARALSRIQDPGSFDALVKALADEDTQVMVWAAFGVGRLCRGHEPDAVRRLSLRAASLSAGSAGAAQDAALPAIAFALGRCASDDAEKSLRAWLTLRPPLAEAAAFALGHLARLRQRLDDATVASLLDLVEKAQSPSALFAIESLPALGGPARARLLEVAPPLLEKPGPARAFAARALAKASAEAAPSLGQLLERDGVTDAERADAGRALASLGSAGQSQLARALPARVRALIDAKAWLTSASGVVLTLLDGLEPGRADAAVLKELSELPLADEPPGVVRRKVALRCRAASLLAGRASASAPLLACDPAPPGERREGSLARLKVLARGPLDKERAPRFVELARSEDPVVREAALELLMAHDEVPDLPALLASALGAKTPGVRATAAKVLARYPARAKPSSGAGDAGRPSAPELDARVVQALTEQLGEVGHSNNIELSAWLLDAASSLSLLGVRPALERACASSNPTLREHAERGFAALGEPKHVCPAVPGSDTAKLDAVPDFRLELDTDVGPLTLNLWGSKSPFATQRFVELARAGFYDGMLIHRVVPGFVVQLGDPDGDGFGGADLPPLRCQLSDEAFDTGSVGVALSGRDTGLSQFFVTLRPAPHLVGEYSLVGRADPGWEALAVGDRIRKVRVVEL
jgi:cyclophilin family peptidyl-prolyl cis-trans isomerase